MPRNGFFGVKNSHFALVTDEDKLTYENPVHVAGTVEISMEPSVETATSYADNEPWIEKQQDDGGSGTMSFYDTESTPELRQTLWATPSQPMAAPFFLQTRSRSPLPSCASSPAMSQAAAAVC